MLLSLTCSSPVGSVSVSIGDDILETLSWRSERSHAEYVSLKISELTQKHSLQKLSALAVDVGPGSFTGIRIAVNTIKTLGYSLDLPIVTASALEILGYQAYKSPLPVTCLIDAFSNSVYASTFFEGRRDEPRVVKSLELKNLFKSKNICIGDGFSKYASSLEEVKEQLVFDSRFSNVPTSEILSKLAQNKLQKKTTISWNELEPMYLRRSSAEEKLLV